MRYPTGHCVSLVAVLLLGVLGARAFADATVTVEVLNVSHAEGEMVLTVYDSGSNWLRSGMLREAQTVGGRGTVTFSIELPPGEYAFHAFQDLDGNGRMRTNFIGIPREPTAVSNDATGRFGPPRFRDASIAVGEAPVSVRMNLVSIGRDTSP